VTRDAEASLASRVTKEGYEVHIRLPYRTAGPDAVKSPPQRSAKPAARATRSGNGGARAQSLLGRTFAHA